MPQPGELLGGRYRLDERIAAGGMGEVWAATDTVLGRPVAVKTLLGGLGADSGFLNRFQHEARTMAALRHPGVVPVYDFGETEDGAFLVMARVAGQPLNRLLADRGQLTVAETMSVVAQAGRALQAAHEAGVVHRDVKPGNLIIEPDGTVVLVDFGVARSANSVTLTGAREVVGTALYIAPEQVSKRATGPAADIYALGAVAYHCLAGRPPFLGDNPLAVALQHVTDEPAPLAREIPRPVRDLVGIALAKDPAERFPSAATMAAAAESAADGIALRPGAATALLATAANLAATEQAAAGRTGTAGTIGTAGTAGTAETNGTAGAGTAGFTGTAGTAGTNATDGTGTARTAETAATTRTAVPAGAFAARAMVGAPRHPDLPPGPARDGHTMAVTIPASAETLGRPAIDDPELPPPADPTGPRRKRALLTVIATVLLLLGAAAAIALADPFHLFGDDPTGGTAPGAGQPSTIVKTSETPATTRKQDHTDRPRKTTPTPTRNGGPATEPTTSAQPTETETSTEETTDPTEDPTTAAPTDTETSSDDGDTGDTGGDTGGNGENTGGNGGGEENEGAGANDQ
ncbi:protein kinase [Actinoplanes oblitus]|uniref:non-specific serine/threonine protein kinase n=1 Tax=Actinoplanes oblitus TaxID=3040509 RepID=A0ABY8WCV2_9ACTN|nr:serine/threonine-protein kinase [Actinoplanes oblitus]WIM94730.1 protein kinase [Actinoplanes oblitus]